MEDGKRQCTPLKKNNPNFDFLVFLPPKPLLTSYSVLLLSISSLDLTGGCPSLVSHGVLNENSYYLPQENLLVALPYLYHEIQIHSIASIKKSSD